MGDFVFIRLFVDADTAPAGWRLMAGIIKD